MKQTLQEDIIISDSDREAFMAGLKAGLGLTKSADLILVTPKYMSDYLNARPEFLRECERSVKYSAKVLLVLSNQYLKERKYKKWKENNEYIKSFISNIYLWESHCQRNSITPLKAAEAYVLTNDKNEAATICGMTIQEYNYYLLLNPNTKHLIEVMLQVD